MSLICPACQATYNVDPNLLGPNGRKVRCANCGNTWMALPPMPLPPEPSTAQPELPPENKIEAKLNFQSDLADFAGPQLRVIPAANPNHDFAAIMDKADAEREPEHQNFRPVEHAPPKAPAPAWLMLFHQYFIPASLVMLALVLGLIIMAKSTISKHAPGMIAVYNMLGINPLPPGGGLAIMNVRDESRFGQLDNSLVIHGDLVNRTNATLKVPLFKMEITSPAGQTKTFMARGPIEKIEPGAIVPFTLERAGFAAEGWDVKLTFGDGTEKDPGKSMQAVSSSAAHAVKE